MNGPTRQLSWFLEASLSLTILLMSQVSFGGNAAPVVLQPQQNIFGLGPYLEILEDSEHSLSFTQVKEQPNLPWQTSKSAVPTFGFSTSRYWLRFTLENPGDGELQRLLEVEYSHYDIINFYLTYPSRVEKYEMGALLPFSNRPISYRNFLVPITLAAYQKVQIYVSAESSGSVFFSLNLWEPSSFGAMHSVADHFAGFYYGILLAMFCYNLFLFVTTKKNFYLYYILYLGGFFFFQYALHGYGFQHLWPTSPWWAKHCISFFLAFALLWVTVFSIDVLETKYNTPRIHRLLIGIAIMSLVTLLLSLFGAYFLTIRIGTALALIGAPLFLISGSIAIKKGHRPAIFYVLAFAAFLIGIIINALKQFGVIEQGFFAEYAIQMGSAIEMIMLSLALGDKIRLEQETSNGKIRSLNFDLEKLVEARTRAIAGILNNVQSGFFLVDKLMRILPGFTRSCNSRLRLDLTEGKNFFEIFAFSERERDSFDCGFAQVFDDILPEIVTLANLSTRHVRKDRIFDLRGSVVRDEHQHVFAVLFSIEDITALVNLERENAHNRMMLHILYFKDCFRTFIADTYERNMLMKSQLSSTRQVEIKQSLHTIKGNASLFEMNELCTMIHQIESHEIVTISDIVMIELNITEFLQNNFKVLGIQYETQGETSFVIYKSDGLRLKQQIKNMTNQAQREQMFNSWLHEICSSPVVSLLGPIEQSLTMIAAGIGKEISFEFVGGDIKIDPHQYKDVIRNLIHLMRNAVYHGIEEPFARLHKKQRAQVKLTFQDRDDHLQIEVEDNGRGIDTDKLIQEAIATRQLTDEAARRLNNEDKLNLVFVHGLSTNDRTNISEISGRGYGMAALRSAVLMAKGEITVATSKGLGTKFTIKLPKYLDERAQKSS